ncbi:MAG TPA: peptide ABC transporter substrate-binding protein [Caulobacteraceae bacterium]|nr:peptide ABC transporter substrate-binding protein [Caulobacteraceae bacterium]
MRFAVILLVALCLAACGRGQAVRPACPAGQVCLELGNQSDPVSLDPAKITGTWEDRIESDLIVGLIQDDAEGRPVPGVATSWTTSPDGLTWTFHLRKATWSDGSPLTADDFVYALRRLLDPRTGSEYASLMYVIQNAEAVNAGKLPPSALGVRATDPLTLEIRLVHPAPYLPELAKHQTMYPVPRHVVEQWGDAWTRPGHFVGDGPFELTDWRLGDYLRVVKNPLFWDAATVCADRIDYLPTADTIAAERRVKRGELDANDLIVANRVAFLRRPDQMPGYVRAHTYLGIYYLAFNTHDVPAFRDPRVRIALSMSLDREFAAGKLLQGVNKPAYTFVPPGVAGYASPPPPIWASWPLARRQAAARVLLRQAGYGPDHPLAVEIKQANSTNGQLLTPSIQSDWAAIGVRASLVLEETQIAYQDFRLRDFQVASAAWIADYNDAMSFLYLMQSKTGAQNYGDYVNPAYDALLAQADNEPDTKRRAAILARAESLMLADAAVAPFYFGVNTNLVNPRVTGFVDNIVDHHRSRYLCVKGAGPAKAPAP